MLKSFCERSYYVVSLGAGPCINKGNPSEIDSETQISGSLVSP